MTFSAGDALENCVYAGRFRVTFPIFDADGDLVTGATGLDSEKSLDSGTFADCSNEATEIATASGVYYLDLIASETTGNNVTVIVKTSSAGAKTTILSIPVYRWPVLESGTAQAGAGGTITLASGASAKDSFYNGMYIQCTNNSPANVQGMTRMIVSYVGSTKVATVESNWGTTPSSATTYSIMIPMAANMAAVSGQRMPDWGTAGVPKVDAAYVSGTALTARDIGASVLLSTGTGTGQLDFTSGVVKASLAQILGTAISGTAAQIAAAFTKFFDKATPTGTINSIPDVVAGAAGGLFIAGTNAATSVTTALTANITGNLSGSVGSVTGNVGGNVTGTVGTVNALATNSITAASIAADAVNEVIGIVSGTSDSGTTTTMVDAARTEADTDYWKGAIITFTSGNIAGQSRLIVSFTPATDTITFVPATTQTVATQDYVIRAAARTDSAMINGVSNSSSLAQMGVNVVNWGGSAAPAMVGGRIDASVGAMAADVLTAAATATDFSTEVTTALLASVIEGSLTLVQALRLILSVSAGKLSGAAGTTVTIRDTTDTKSRVIATVDFSGNRSAVTLDAS